MKQIDARGKACPQPVMMTKAALAEHPEAIRVTVDNPEAGQNVSRYLKSQGYEIALTAEDANIIVDAVKTGAAVSPSTVPEASAPSSLPARRAVFIAHDVVGGDDKELGEVLIKAFLGTLPQLDEAERPAVIALMNEGVKLALKGTSSAEALQEYVDKGGSLLVCGTCLKHFGVLDQLGVGVVSNMYEIVSSLLNAQTLTI